MAVLTPSEIAEVRMRCEAATPGPWAWKHKEGFEGEWHGLITEHPVPRSQWDDGEDVLWFNSDHYYDSCTISVEGSDADVAFIAQARSDIPRLLETIEYLERAARGSKRPAKASGTLRV